jgi:Fic/DOC family
MNHGLRRLHEGFPLSLRLIREIHEILLAKGHGSDQHPRKFRTSQNWIVPAPVTPRMFRRHPRRLTSDVPGMPLLVRAALAHVQFETIHPFLDGNVPALCRGRDPRADPYTSVCISRRTGSVTMSCSDAPLLPFSECISTCSATRSCRFPQPQGSYRSLRRQSPKPCGICKSSALFGRPLEGSATGCRLSPIRFQFSIGHRADRRIKDQIRLSQEWLQVNC